jgi:hypothetical protein
VPPSHRRGTVSTRCSECEACCVLSGTKTDCFREPWFSPAIYASIFINNYPELVRPISGRSYDSTIKLQAVPCNVTLRCALATIVTVEKQLMLLFLSVCL